MKIKPIAHIRTDFTEKFGIPRQSGLAESIKGRIVFCPEYRNPDALRGLEQYTHIWLIWEFSEAIREKWSPTVRPPRLGGNTRMGVFATRSPFRPNPIGLSSVRIENIELNTNEGPVIIVSGADMMDNTPIYDIKPYLPYVDIHSGAADGFALNTKAPLLDVTIPEEIASSFPQKKLTALKEILSQDPRPQYQDDPDRIYTMSFAGYDVSFTISDGTASVISVIQL